MKSQIAQTPKGPMEYTLIGNGPVLLICHGTSEDCHSTHAFEPFVESGFRLLTPSRPGHGRTPLDTGPDNLQAAEAMIALLDCLNIQVCSVIAVSAGGPTGIALAARFPQRIARLVLMAAVSQPEARVHEPSYRNQMAFYGPLHGLQWGFLRLLSILSPRAMARQTMMIFSTHDTEDAFHRLSPQGIESIRLFYQGHSSRVGALNDATHTVGKELLQAISTPALVIHSREDQSVPFNHAEWSLQHIAGSTLCEAGYAGHFVSVGSDYAEIMQHMIAFLCNDPSREKNDHRHDEKDLMA